MHCNFIIILTIYRCKHDKNTVFSNVSLFSFLFDFHFHHCTMNRQWGFCRPPLCFRWHSEAHTTDERTCARRSSISVNILHTFDKIYWVIFGLVKWSLVMSSWLRALKIVHKFRREDSSYPSPYTKRYQNSLTLHIVIIPINLHTILAVLKSMCVKLHMWQKGEGESEESFGSKRSLRDEAHEECEKK